MSYQHLLWDSSFFGYPVACMSYENIEQIKEDFERLSVAGYRLVYFASSTLLDIKTSANIPGKLVLADKKLIFSKQLDKNPLIVSVHPKIQITPYNSSMCKEKVINLGVQSGVHSRFSVDENIKTADFIRLYTAWVENSLSKDIASEVFVLLEKAEIKGMITMGEKKSRGDIGLIAIDKGSRGRGYGRMLLQASLNWFVKEGYDACQVVTQGGNDAACRLYNKLGFKVEKISYIYHVWL